MKPQIRYTILTLIPVLAIAAMIFFFSAQNAEDSSVSSGRVAALILQLVTDAEPDDPDFQIKVDRISGVVRKLAHFTEYLLFGFFLLLHMHNAVYTCRRSLPVQWSAAAATGILYAVTDELHQLLISGRAAQVTDVLIDSSSVIVGTATFLLLLCLLRKISRRTNQS